MAAQETFKTALDDHYQRVQMLEESLAGQDLVSDEELCTSYCTFGTWLRNQDVSLEKGDEELLKLQELHENYHRALEKLICLHNKDSIDQARSFYEEEFKEQSLKLTAVMLRWINLFNQEELRRHETL